MNHPANESHEMKTVKSYKLILDFRIHHRCYYCRYFTICSDDGAVPPLVAKEVEVSTDSGQQLETPVVDEYAEADITPNGNR